MKFPVVKPPITMEENASVYFEVPTGNYIVDPITQNEEPEYTELEVKAHIVETSINERENENAGLDQKKVGIRGYLLVTSLPDGIRSSDRVKVVMRNSGKPEQGTLFFREKITSMRDNIVATIGIPIEGYFQSIGGGT